MRTFWLGMRLSDTTLRLAMNLNDYLKYSAETGLAVMLSDLNKPEYADHRQGKDDPLSGLRGVLADAMDEAGRSEEAQLLRTPHQHVVTEDGTIKPGAFKVRHAFYADGDEELEQMIDEHGLETALHHIKDNYDYGSGNLTDITGGGGRDHKHYVSLPNGEEYMIGHHPGLGYVYTEHRMEVPADATHALEGGKFLRQKGNR